VLTRSIEARICWTGTRLWHTLFDGYEILVLLGDGVTPITNTNAFGDDGELEGFVLGALCHSLREF
jgi:hypothetical protein